MGHRRLLSVAVIGSVLVVASCSSSGTSDVADPASPATAVVTTPAPTGGYVALGDSYTAGPGIDPQQTGAGFCGRATMNWPALLGDALDLPVTDLSCSGATTADVAATVASGSVPAEARLVTVSVGGNDGGLFLSLIRSCTAGSTACEEFARDQVPQILGQTTSALTDLLDDVQVAAPRARVVLVGYPRIMPADGTCDAVGISPDDVRAVVGAESALDAALVSAARSAGVDHISLREPSAGHDACAGEESWTNGAAPEGGDGIVFHPEARGMAAIAGVVADALVPG